MKKYNLNINLDNKKSVINPEIYGQFSEHLGRCIYDGIFVGQDSDIENIDGIRVDVIEALKAIKVPVLRWPGGCFAEEYHWRDGIGPAEDRPVRINTNWGGVPESNAFGTHEFLRLCELVGCEPYIAINLGSGTVQEAAEWIEYLTYDGDTTLTRLRAANGHPEPWKIKYIGIGNENWGMGGSMEPEYYADEYRKYQSFIKNLSGNELYKVACGPDGASYHWTDVLMQKINKWHANAISLHYYTIPTGEWEHKGSSTEFSDDEYYSTISNALRLGEIIDKHLEIMDMHDPNHDIDLIVDEWGVWTDVIEGTNPGFLYQQNSMRDAIVAALSLNILNNRSSRVKMSNIAQMVNVLQAMILTDREKMITTPTYEVYKMYVPHQGANNLEVDIQDVLNFSCSASVKDGWLNVSLVNISLCDEVEVNLEVIYNKMEKLNDEFVSDKEAWITELFDKPTTCNTFSEPEKLKAKKREIKGMKSIILKPCSVNFIEIKL